MYNSIDSRRVVRDYGGITVTRLSLPICGSANARERLRRAGSGRSASHEPRPEAPRRGLEGRSSANGPAARRRGQRSRRRPIGATLATARAVVIASEARQSRRPRLYPCRCSKCIPELTRKGLCPRPWIAALRSLLTARASAQSRILAPMAPTPAPVSAEAALAFSSFVYFFDKHNTLSSILTRRRCARTRAGTKTS